MDRPLSLMIAISVASTPIPVVAQTGPATSAAGAVRLTPQPTSTASAPHRTVIVRRPTPLKPTQPDRMRDVVVPAPARTDEIPAVEVRPKEAWLDDQGLRLTPTRLAFKRRF